MIFNKKVVATHSGKFHADDLFAVATLMLLEKNKLKIVRTREKEKIDKADYVVDVGLVLDPSKKRFDHHQAGGAGVRDNGIPYASFGLVWKEYGSKICGDDEVAKIIEKRIVMDIDAGDNGIMTFKNIFEDIYPVTIFKCLLNTMPTWQEKQDLDSAFKKSVGHAKMIIEREIAYARALRDSFEIVRKRIQESKDKRVVVFDEKDKFSEEEIFTHIKTFPEIIYIVTKNAQENNWKAKAVRINPESFENKKPFPKEWGGKSDSELEKITGVSGAVFCHRALFLVVAKTREAVLELVQKSLNS